MIKWANFFMPAIRRSGRPQKQLLWFYIAEILEDSAYFEKTLDVACGKMSFYSHIKSREYVGLDIDKESIDYGISIYPKTKGVVGSMYGLNSSLTAGFVLCLQTIGINNHFDVGRTKVCIDKLTQATEKGGNLCFNIGPKALSKMPIGSVESELMHLFKEVRIHRYGRGLAPRNQTLSYVLAVIMKVIPSLALPRNEEDVYILYYCKNKLS